MGSIVERLRGWWNNLERSQRPVWAIGAVLVVVLFAGAAMFAGRPQSSMLFGGLSPADQGMVVEELGKLGIKADYDASGNVLVPTNKVAEARAKLALAKKLPNSGNMGYNSLNDIGMMTSPAVEKEKIKASHEGELASTIKSMTGVSDVRVHLSMGETSPFLRETKPPTASITITAERGMKFGADQAQSIARLVQFAESGLTPDNITIVTSDGVMLYDGSQEGSTSASTDKRLGVENDEAKRRERDLQTKLDAAFGVGNTIVSIPVLKMNFDKIRSTEIVKDPSKKPTSKETVKENMSNGGALPGGNDGGNGNAGTTSNTQAPAEIPKKDEGAYESLHTKEGFETNEKETFTEKASGELQSMAINVLVNTSKIKDAAAVETYVGAYVAPLAAISPESFTTQVTPVEFDVTQATEASKAQGAAASAAKMQQMMAILPVAALILVAMMVVKALGKAANTFAPAPRVEAALPAGGTINMYYEQPAMDSFAQPLPEMVLNQMTPEQVIEYQQTGELADSLRNLAATMHATKQIEIEAIPEKVHIPLEQLKQLAENNPESIANIMKTLILEERK